MLINPCGETCSECHYFNSHCNGKTCHEIEGKVFWNDGNTCRFYDCCTKKVIAHCGFCNEIPCKIWFETRDPSITDDDEFKKNIELRVTKIKKLI